MEITQLARDIARSIQGQEPVKAAIIEANYQDGGLEEFVQLVLDKTEAIGGYDFADYDEDDDDDYDDEDDDDDDSWLSDDEDDDDDEPL